MREAKFECPICHAEATATGKVLRPSLQVEIEALCPECGARYYRRIIVLFWGAPHERVAVPEREEKKLPEGKAGDQFVQSANAALLEEIRRRKTGGEP